MSEEAKNEEKKADNVLAAPTETVPEPPRPIIKEKVTCTLCVPPAEYDSYSIYDHVGTMHKGYAYSRKEPHFFLLKDKPRPGALSGGKSVSKPGDKSSAVPEKKKFSLNIGLKLNLSILDGLGKLAEDKEAFALDASDMATLKEAYDAMGGILTTDDPRIAILVINGKVVIPGILFNWEKIKENWKKKFTGIFKKNFTESLEETLKKSAERRNNLERERAEKEKQGEQKTK